MTDTEVTFSVPLLSEQYRIGLLGDVHGDLEHLLTVCATMWARGISSLLVLGDWGFIWPGSNWDNVVDKISKRLRSRGQALFFVDGNHEWHPRLLQFPIAEDGLRWIRPNIAHLPRGYRTRLKFGMTLAALGGANSIDVGRRTAGQSWWAEESITDADLTALGSENADIMVGHDAPLGVPTLDRFLAETVQYWSEAGVAYADAGRQMFHRGFLHVRPALYLGGHYHHPIDETVVFDPDEQPFTTRVVLLNKNQSTGASSQGILNVRTLELDLFRRDDAAVTELHGYEAGVWRVQTRDSAHLFDLVRGTGERVPGENAIAQQVDAPRGLRSIERCRVGERGYWTYRSGDFLVDFYWHASSVVEAIERIPAEERAT